jgi:signal transduction histidine kinase
VWQLTRALERQTSELAAANRRLRRGIAQRAAMEEALKTSGKRYAGLLQDSLRVQERLRHLAHEILLAQEDERKKVSHELQDEIAQTLLGINVRLLSLKQDAKANTHRLKNEIASTQKLVAASARTVRRISRGIGSHHEA